MSRLIINILTTLGLMAVAIVDAVHGDWLWYAIVMVALAAWSPLAWKKPRAKTPTVLTYQETVPTPDWLKRGYEPVETPNDQRESSVEQRCGSESCSCKSWGRS